MPRLLKLFDRAGLRTSWFIPGHTAESFPTQTAMVAEAGHEIGLHGYSHENPLAMSPEQERAVLERSIAVLEQVAGRRPVVAPRQLEELWRDQFDWVYREEEYTVFPLTIHPDVSGRP